MSLHNKNLGPSPLFVDGDSVISPLDCGVEMDGPHDDAEIVFALLDSR